MSTRNTPVLQEIVDVLFREVDEQAAALNRLEHHFHDRLLLDVANVFTVGEYAEQLRLNISQEECFTVLDHSAEQKMVTMTVDHVEQVVWDLFGNRFIEP